jgi:hypothetical protein
MRETRITTMKDVLAEMATPNGAPEMVRDWRSMVPEGSRWHPNDPGNPACKICEGTGYLRLDLPVGHKHFGELIFCECAAEKVRQWEARKMADSSVDQLRALPKEYR